MHIWTVRNIHCIYTSQTLTFTHSYCVCSKACTRIYARGAMPGTFRLRVTQFYSFIQIKTYVLVMTKSQSTNIRHIRYYLQRDFHLEWLCRAFSRHKAHTVKKVEEKSTQSGHKRNQYLYKHHALTLNKICYDSFSSHSYTPKGFFFIGFSDCSF